MRCKLICNVVETIIMIIRRYSWFVILLLFSASAIYIIKLTDFRPWGSAEKYEEINSIIVNLSYSYIAATIFHIVMIICPGIRRRKIMRRKIESYLLRMESAIKLCITHIHLYSLDSRDYKVLPKEEFIEKFSKKDLTPPCGYLKILEQMALKISLLVELLLNIQEYLSDEEIEKLMIVKDSLFLTQTICPTFYIENDDGSQCEIPDSNQKEMAESIYNIYELINDLVCKQLKHRC